MKTGDNKIKIIPLGGLGEIGLNMMVFEQDEDIMVIDCGLMFPGDSLPGVDYIIPDFTYLIENRERVRGIVLTHGHEDHIGALPFLLSRLSVPLYGTPLTMGLVKERLVEHSLAESAVMKVIKAGESFSLGNFEVEFIRMSHSIADCVALAVKTSVGHVIHTGDFKLDPTPVDGKRVDLSSLARYGESGVTVLLSDSSNVEREGYTLSEREVGKALQEVFQAAQGRLIIAMFASNVHRMQQAMDVAAANGRKVALLGRNMEGNARIAMDLGYVTPPNGVLTDPAEIKNLPDDKIVLLTTGTQGEPLSGLARMARDEHKHLKIKSGDTVVLSSRFIPGNERAISYLINEFYRRGAEVIYEKVSEIHVSGHASQEELKLMISLTRPQYFIPVHGEYRHLVKHAQLAVKMGVPKERVLVAEDGDVIFFDHVGGERRGRIEVGRQVVDGLMLADSGDEVLRERCKLGKEGVLVAAAIIDTESGDLLGPIRLSSRGFLFEKESEDALEEAKIYAEQEIHSLPRCRRSKKEVEAQIKAALKRYIKKNLMRFPEIVPVVIEI